MTQVYRFDDIEIDLTNYRVLKAGRVVQLEPKALSVLTFLVENRGRLVEKRALIDAVWKEAFVTDNVLSRIIAQLRKALGDGAKEARYIETVPTRGYRFIAEVQVEEVEDAQSTNGGAIVPSSVTPQPASASLAVTAGTSWHRPLRYLIAALAFLGTIAVVVVGIAFYRRRAAPEHLQILRETQLTACDGLCMYPAISPDGNSMAFSADHGNGFEIFVRQLTPGGQELQVTSDGGQNMQPAWSPDGKSIAYTSKGRSGIWIVPAFGGPGRKLTDFGSHPAWSRDGQSIAFQSAPLDDVAASSPGVFPPSTIWIMRPDGTGARQITEAGKPEGGHGLPSWSPNGEHIVFAAYTYGGSRLWSITPEGTGLVNVAQSGQYFYDPVYSPDGESVVYGALRQGNFRLLRIAISPATSAPLGEPIEIMNSAATFSKHLSYSNDGKKILYAAETDKSSLQSLTISPSGGPPTEPHSLISAVGCRVTFPTFSPDGSRIAFSNCIGRSGVDTQISVMNSDGSNVQQLTLEPGFGNEPGWYPDGRRILFLHPPGLFSVDVQTREQKHVVDFTVPPGRFAISPDGTQVVMSPTVGGVINLWLMSVADGTRKQITFDKEMLGFPVWSADGKFLAGELRRGTDTNVAILPSSGGPVTQLTFDHGNNWTGCWSPDGDKIIFFKQQSNGIWNIWSVSRSTKIEKQITDYKKLTAFVRYASMSPRGNQLVYEYSETTGNIWMLEFK